MDAPQLASLVVALVLGPMGGIGVIRGAIGFRPLGQQRAIERLAVRLGLDTSRDIRVRLFERAARLRRAAIIGTAVGWVAGIPVAVQAGESYLFFLPLFYFTMAGALAGLAVGSAAAGFELDPSSPRVARLEARQAADYLEPLVVVGARVGVAVVAIAALLLWSPEPAATLRAALALAAIGLLVGTELLAAALARRPQHARTEEELRWDDGLRAVALNGLFGVPALVGATGLVVGGLPMIGTAGASVFDSIVYLVLAVVALVGLVVFTARPPGRAALRRLHPEAFEGAGS
ncbi:hypothetical protein [Agromyces seonyuensis]|uniref:Uncharacterized protein n=1 Tax=Agromyces seonyuensis TaxID=2662446 RepID=A0A6I4NXT5_9MICO|nr:hypothetical protein [Agromyces seonyuensis]MWB97952.1 hypothetical protein [Agromyces seonyuensis]